MYTGAVDDSTWSTPMTSNDLTAVLIYFPGS